MIDTKKGARAPGRLLLYAFVVVCLIILFAHIILTSDRNNDKATTFVGVNISAEGEYITNGGAPNKMEEDRRIPSTKGEATLCGGFKTYSRGGIILTCVLAATFIGALIIALLVNHKKNIALKKNEELELWLNRLTIEKSEIESELKESRVSIMSSQISPHFIYNTLGTIEHLCLKDPQMASRLAHNFSLYLRGNLSKLDSVEPIRFSEEIKHVEYYANIEKVRFPDITIEYQFEISDFLLPAISVQPLVENAIKHGLMPIESGGKVVIRSYETDTHFCVEVSDNGVGFDTSSPIDKKTHVGLYNVRERLGAIVNGELRVESAKGVGTTATILIPKEEKA